MSEKNKENKTAIDEKEIFEEETSLDQFNIEDDDSDLSNFDLDDLETEEGLDDSFLDNFEDAMLSETELGTQVQKVEITPLTEQAKLDPNVSDDHNEQVLDMISRANLDVDVKKVENIDGVNNLDIDFEKLDINAIDLSKIEITPLATDDLKIGFDLDKINLQEFDINIEDVDIDNIDFDKIQIDLGGIVSFEEAEKEIKKSNVLLPAPVKGVYGRLILNPLQELKNAFAKSYNEILQIARPAEAYKRQIEEGIIIEAKDIIKVHKKNEEKISENKEETALTEMELEAEKLAEQELQETLGKDWNKIEDKSKENQKKEKKTIEVKAIIVLLLKKIRSFYLRIFLISWTSKILLIMQLSIGVITAYYFSTNIMSIIEKIYSTRESANQTQEDALEVLAVQTKDPQKRIPGPYASLPKLMGSFIDTQKEKGTRLFQMGLFIELENYDAQEEFNSKAVLIQDRILSYLNNVNYHEINSTLGKEKLKTEMQIIINNNLKRGKVISLYYSDFVVN